MAKKHIDVELLTDDWIAVSESEEPIAFAAWRDWRREALGARFVPKAYTVPSLFPPTTPAAVNEYVGILSQIRKSIDWSDARAKLPTVVRPWHG